MQILVQLPVIVLGDLLSAVLDFQFRDGLLQSSFCAGLSPVFWASTNPPQVDGWPIAMFSEQLNFIQRAFASADRVFAERLRLADSTGTVIDHVVVGGADGDAPDGCRC